MSDTIYHIAQPDGSTRQATVMEITQEIKAGTITQETPLWCSSWTDWRNCGTIPFFAPFFKVTSVPPPSPYQTIPPPSPSMATPPPIKEKAKDKKMKPWMMVVAGSLMAFLLFGIVHAVVDDSIKKYEKAESEVLPERKVEEKVSSEMLMSAVEKGDSKKVSELLNKGANPNAQFDGMTPLMHACCNGKVSCVKAFLDQGADVSIKGKEGRCKGLTALHCALIYEKPKCLQLLVEYGSDVNERIHVSGVTPPSGLTPLMYACGSGQPLCVKILIEGGADVNARAGSGLTALDMALGKNDIECAKLLRAAGADSKLLRAVGAGK